MQVAAGLAVVLATGCDTRQNPLIASLEGTPGSGSSTFNIAPRTLTLEAGQTAQLTLNSTRAIGPYNWATNLPGIATVDQSGLVTGIGPGVATITVTSSVDRTVSAAATVTVRSDTSPSN